MSNFGTIRQFFNPADFQEHGRLGYIQQKYFTDKFLWDKGAAVRTVEIGHDNCQIFNSKWIDLSQFDAIYGG